MDFKQTASDLNTLSAFCGMRDTKNLNMESALNYFDGEKADVIALFGGSIVCGGDVLAEAINNGIASKYVIVGNEGHTTDYLRNEIKRRFPCITTSGEPEAVVFDRYLQEKYGLKADLLETRSTNCGNNITNLLALLKENGIPCRRIILCQDASMQRRMDAGMRRHCSPGTRILNFAAYKAVVTANENRLAFRDEIPGMWSIEKYAELLMGEIPRLRDDINGYGPNGKGFIAHVDVPREAEAAYERLKAVFGDSIRAANAKYA